MTGPEARAAVVLVTGASSRRAGPFRDPVEPGPGNVFTQTGGVDASPTASR